MPCPPPGDLPDPGNEPRSPALQADSFLLSHQNKVKWLRRAQLFVTPWTVAYQAPPSMGFSRQEYWSEVPFPSPGNLPSPGNEPGSPALQADALPSEPPGKPLVRTVLRCNMDKNQGKLAPTWNRRKKSFFPCFFAFQPILKKVYPN